MSAIYTGSNFGVISMANSYSGSLGSSTSYPLQYENIQNYTTCSILVSTTVNAILKVNFSNAPNSSSVLSSDSYMINGTSTGKTINFVPNGQYMQLVFYGQNGQTLSGTCNVQTRFNNTSSGEQDSGYLSGLNSFVGVTGSASSNFYGAYESVEDYSSITAFASGTLVSGQTGPAPGTIECTFSSDGVVVDRVVRYTVQDVTASQGYTAGATSSSCFNPPHTMIPISRYFKLTYTNGAVPVYPLNISVLYHKNKSKSVTSIINDYMTDYADTDTSRNILLARTIGTELPGGNYQNIGASNSTYNGAGYLATSIKDPITAFGEVLTASLTPASQIDFIQGLPPDTIDTWTNIQYAPPGTTGGFWTFNNSLGTVGITGNTTAGNTGAKAYIRGHELAKYKAGQGVDGRFTAVYPNISTTGVTGCSVYAGLHNKESSITLGYFYDDSGNSSTINPLIYNKFAIRHQTQGRQQINQIVVTGTNNSSGTVSITFTSATYGTLPVSASINASDETVNSVCFKIVSAINSSAALNTWGWTAQYYLSGTTGYVNFKFNYSSSAQISVSGTGSTAGFTFAYSTLRAGQACTNNYYIQYGATGQYVNLWNLDRCYDQGSLQQNYLYNPTGFRLVPSNGNVFKISVQYLGFGAVTLYIESTNTGLFIPVHQIKWTNNNTLTNFSDPSFRPTIAVENYTNTVTNTVSISTGSLSTFVQGITHFSPIYRSIGNSLSLNTAMPASSNPAVLFGVLYRNIFDSSNSFGATNYYVNRTNVLLTSISLSFVATTKSGTSVVASILNAYLVKNPSSFYNIGTVNAYYPQWRYVINDVLYNFITTAPITTTNTTGTGYNGGTIVKQFSLAEGNSIIFDLTDNNIYMGQGDTFIIAFDGVEAASSTLSIFGSISWQVNI